MPNNCAYLADKEVLFTGWMVKAPPEHKMKRKTGFAKVITYVSFPTVTYASYCRDYEFQSIKSFNAALRYCLIDVFFNPVRSKEKAGMTNLLS